MTFKRLNNIFGWVAGIIAFIVYLMTMEPTVSWWDCGEYISTAYKLQVGHPPGAPLFQMLGRFFSLFAFGDVTKVAMMINVMSCLCSGLTITFLFWTITLLARKIWMKEGEDSPRNNKIGVLVAAFIGSMAYTFTESFWFNAVEGEVYAMSSFFTAVTFWAILKWEQVADEPQSYRWIIFIAYLIGLSIGVHLLNLLCIPAFVFVVYFRKWKKTTFGGFLLTGLIALALLWLINMVLVPQVVNLAGKTELFFVNSLNLPFNSGTIFYFSLLTILIVVGLLWTIKRKKVIWNTIILSLMFILIGYSSFFMLAIRANTNTPINENEPKDALSMLSYLNREQYGDWPLLYGPYYNAIPTDLTETKPAYVKGKETKDGKEVDRYIITRQYYDYEYPSEMKTLFPRMWSRSDKHAEVYERYRKDKNGRIKSNNVGITLGNGQTFNYKKPTFGQNLRFFFDYQCHWMYWRYFMWNFVGRQNDIESQGEISHGNWISGIGFIDNARLGNQNNLPESMHNSGRTQYYFLPLILGLIGLFWLLFKDLRQSWVIFLLFFMTGLAIVIYLNQTPYQPRERDYSYAGSFYAFAIWIGFGVLALIDWIQQITKNKSMVTNIAVGAVCLLAVPCLMASQGWEEHNRSGKTSAHDWAVNYLTQLPPNSVIFTRGDNDTFPLWYIQEVEGFRTDVRVCNYMLASGYWYVHQMGRKVYDSEKLPLTLPPQEYDNGVNESVKVIREPQFQGRFVELKEAIDYFNSPNGIKFNTDSGRDERMFPCLNVKLTVDKEACIRNGIVPESMKDRVVDEIKWTIGLTNDAEISTVDGLNGRVFEVRDTTAVIVVQKALIKNSSIAAGTPKQDSIVAFFDNIYGTPEVFYGRVLKEVNQKGNSAVYVELDNSDRIREVPIMEIKSADFISRSRNPRPGDVVTIKDGSLGVVYQILDYSFLVLPAVEVDQLSISKISPNPSLIKNSLLLLDFMATNNWERPVYFSSFSDMASVLGIDKYLYMEGLSVRFIPVRVEDNDCDYSPLLGSVYNEGCYDLLVNKAQWGGLNKEGVVPDRESIRNVDFARRSYLRLAFSLVHNGKNEQAVTVMDKYQEFFPNEKIPYTSSLGLFPRLYYRNKSMEKGDDMMTKLMNNFCDRIEYYGNMQPEFKKQYQEKINDLLLEDLAELLETASDYKRKDMQTLLKPIITEYLNKYLNASSLSDNDAQRVQELVALLKKV